MDRAELSTEAICPMTIHDIDRRFVATASNCFLAYGSYGCAVWCRNCKQCKIEVRNWNHLNDIVPLCDLCVCNYFGEAVGFEIILAERQVEPPLWLEARYKVYLLRHHLLVVLRPKPLHLWDIKLISYNHMQVHCGSARWSSQLVLYWCGVRLGLAFGDRFVGFLFLLQCSGAGVSG